MRSAAIAATAMTCLAFNISAAGAADIPVKPRPAAQRVASPSPPPPPSLPAGAEPLFQQLLEWLNRR